MPSSHNELQCSCVSCPIISLDTTDSVIVYQFEFCRHVRRETTMDLHRQRWLDYDVIVIMLLLLVMALVELFVFIT
jgi:hypothetical protein